MKEKDWMKAKLLVRTIGAKTGLALKQLAAAVGWTVRSWLVPAGSAARWEQNGAARRKAGVER
jgi:hypothetical protein